MITKDLEVMKPNEYELTPRDIREMLDIFLVDSAYDGLLQQTFYDLGDEGRPLDLKDSDSWPQVVWDLDTTNFKLGTRLTPNVVAVGFPYVGVSSLDVDAFITECNLDAGEEIGEKYPDYIDKILKMNSLNLLRRILENPDNATAEACLEVGIEHLLHKLEELKSNQQFD